MSEVATKPLAYSFEIAEFCAGSGQHHSDQAQKNARPYDTITWEEITRMMQTPPSVAKSEAQWAIFSTLATRKADKQRSDGCYHALWADLDETPTTLTDAAYKAATAIPGDVYGYTSKSATEAKQKGRLLFPLSEPCTGAEIEILQEILNDRLKAAGLIPDRVTERANQLCYLPNRGEFYATETIDWQGPLNWRVEFADEIKAKQAEIQREEEALKAAQEAVQRKRQERLEIQQSTGQISPIDIARDQYSVRELWESFGAKGNGRRLTSPYSSSGSPAITVNEELGLWYSFHQSDRDQGIGNPGKSGGVWGDAADLIQHFQYNGDRDAMLKGLGEMFTTPEGITINKHNQREYMKAKAGENAAADFDAIPEGSWVGTANFSHAGCDDAPATYDSLMDKVAELNNATSPKEITALAEATASLDQVAAGMVLRAIKDATGLNMGDLKPVAAAARRKKRPPSVTTNGVKRMMPQMFPDVVLDADGEPEKVLQTIPNIAKLLEFYGIHASYNVIKKKTRLVVPNASGSPDNADNSALTSVISLAKLNEIPTEQVPAYVEQIADENQCNPVANWITEKPWDGQDRLQALYDTLTLSVEYPPEMRDLLIRRWLISAVAAVLMPRGFHCRGVLVLQGRQSLGKTRWLQQLVGDSQLKEDVVLVDHNLDPANKDSVTEAITHWLVELGELEGTFRKADIARLKGFITSNMDKVRRPYARLTSEYQRRTVFFASVNDPQFLVDDTGNTRFWTISVDRIDYSHDIDTQQLWAQVAELYQQGEQWWLTSEEETKLEEINQGHRTASSIREMIHTRLDWDCNAPAWIYKTASEVLVAIGYDKPTNMQAKEAGAALKEAKCVTKKSKGYTKFLVPPSTLITADFGDNPAH